MRPLELGFQRAPDAPVSIAEMIVDGRVGRLEFDRAVELLHRLLVIAEPVIGPSERVHDIAVVRALLDRALDHAHAFVEVLALVDPRIAEIVQHVRLVGIKLQRLLEIGLSLVPLLRALEADAAKIQHRPVGALELGDGCDGLAIGFGAFGVLLALAQDAAQRQDRIAIVRIGRDQLVELLLGVLGPVKRVHVQRLLDFGGALER